MKDALKIGSFLHGVGYKNKEVIKNLNFKNKIKK